MSDDSNKPKIDLKARLGKKTVAAGGGASIPPPMGVRPQAAGPVPSPGGSIPAPPFVAARQAAAPAPRIDPSDPYSSVSVAPQVVAAQPQAIRIEMSEEMVEAQKKGRGKVMALAAVTALVGGVVGYAFGGGAERGSRHEAALAGAEMLAGEVDKANGEITKLADTLKKAKASLNDGKYPEAEVNALGGITIPFDGNNLAGKGIGLMGNEVNRLLVKFAGDADAANDQKDRLKRVMAGARPKMEDFLAQKDNPKFNWSVFVESSPSGPIASMQPLPAPFPLKGTWPNEFEVKSEGKVNKLKRYTKGDPTGDSPLLIPVDPATQGMVCPNDLLVVVGREITNLETLLRGDKSDPTDEKLGLLDTGNALVTKLKAIGHATE
jgi:hypothetical protein